MFRNRIYYGIKPYLPRSLRMTLRRWHATRVLRRCGHIWPIDEAAGRKPEGWPGWPDGKDFAFVLTHDVETAAGLDRVRELAELEMELGFRSSFNFVPEGEYKVPGDLRDWLTDRGFEVGVHDLSHDGRLFSSQKGFRSKVQRINGYMKEWKAVGFRAGFMLRNLDWFHDLELEYDASTFDTDPFEPQPDGAGTIYPFWVKNSAGDGYVELPYSLVQDTTLFLLLREATTDVWKRKLEWITEKGGMVLLNTHPDFISFGESGDGGDSYPADYYEKFLQEVRSRYEGRFWHALPRDVAAYSHRHKDGLEVRHSFLGEQRRKKKVWIDLENTPHVPFFTPIIKELENRGYQVVLTARDAFQTCEMAEQYGLPFVKIGRHYGKSPVMKVLGLIFRGLQLIPFALREKPDLGLNHGARAQILACNLMRIPNVMLMDYEHSRTLPLVRPTWEIVPDVVSSKRLHCQARERIRKYSGIKEDVYAPLLKPDPSILSSLGLNGEIIVTVRPPATEAHYHNPEADRLFDHIMERMKERADVRVVLLPRNKSQENEIRAGHPDWFANGKVVIPSEAVDGLNLLWHSDLVISGGGTMNREAAALGVPVYSIFRGRIGAVDRTLEEEGRLTMIKDIEGADRGIIFEHRSKGALPEFDERSALTEIVGHIEDVLSSRELAGTQGARQ